MLAAAIAYFAALYALVLVIVFTGGRGPMLRTILTIAAANALANAFTMTTSDTDPFWWFMAVDFTAALVVLMWPAGRAQAVIGWSFVGKLAMHTGYGLTFLYGDPDAVKYWWGLTGIGFFQLLFVGGWWTYGRRPDLFDFCWVRGVFAASSSESVAR